MERSQSGLHGTNGTVGCLREVPRSQGLLRYDHLVPRGGGGFCDACSFLSTLGAVMAFSHELVCWGCYLKGLRDHGLAWSFTWAPLPNHGTGAVQMRALALPL